MNPEAIKAAAQAWERGRVLQKAGRYREALPYFNAALKTMPNAAALLADYALLAEQLEDWKAAAKLWMKVMQADKDRDVANHIGLALLQQGRNAEALPWLEQFATRHPEDANSAVNLAAAYSRLDRDDESEAVLVRALAAQPGHQYCWEALITLRINRADAKGAAEALQVARKRFPNDPELRYLEMDHRLKNREFAAGFDLFDARWKTRFHLGDMQAPATQVWDGVPFAGTLCLLAEQGVGDELLYSSLLADLGRERIGRVVVECEPRLLPLFARSFPAIHFFARYLRQEDPQRPAFDRQLMAGDLGRFFRRRSDDFPATAGWLRADGQKIASIRQRLDRIAGGNLKVGISWRSKHPVYGDAKSLRLPQLLPVLAQPGVTFVCLQYGEPEADIEALFQSHGLRVEILPEIDPLKDLDAHAALIGALDLVISTSNTAVHLAGALGVPTWVLLHRDRGLPWYWAYEGETVPWYPRTRLIRCRQRGAWDAAIAQAANWLEQRRTGTDTGD